MIISRLSDGDLVEVNARWEKMFGSETVGRALVELNIYGSEQDREKLVVSMKSGVPLHDVELCLRLTSGELRKTLISATREEMGGEMCLLVTIRDITDKKRAEEAHRDLAHASRLAVVGELTAMVAHEVNQPLGAILSNAEAAEMLLESDKPPLDEIRKILADIRKNDVRANEAIRRIRGLLRKREMQLQAVDLDETIADVVRLATGDALRHGVVIEMELTRGLPLVKGDRVHLQQVLLNLILNGMDAMSQIPDSRRRLRIGARENGHGHIEVAVSDCGAGISDDRMPHIFDSFFTTKREGMGLGLSIARSIVEAHNGEIGVENNSSGGATFRFTVPIAAGV
jgi:PAS domain S-box-containing protein